MSRFLQMHILTPYPPSNPNRDDLGRPKTALIGGVSRMRISSQAIKRAMRVSEAFQAQLEGHMGQRTQRLGEVVRKHLNEERNMPTEKATEIARDVAAAFGKLKSDKNSTSIEQLAFISPQEREAAIALADRLAEGGEMPDAKDFARQILQTADGAVDIAMFGRMLADNPDFNRDAAVQVAHAFTTNRMDIEDDYYTAVDDLKTSAEDAGAGFIGEAGFGAGVFYLYICVNRTLLLNNLDGDRELAEKGLQALVQAAATASPSGKKNSYANHVRAEYMLLERGDAQPRTLAGAFTKEVDDADQMGASIGRLTEQRSELAEVYGQDWTDDITLHVGRSGSATLKDLAAFAADGLAEASR